MEIIWPSTGELDLDLAGYYCPAVVNQDDLPRTAVTGGVEIPRFVRGEGMGKLGIGAVVEFCYGESRVIAARIGEGTVHHVISKLGISEAQMIYLSRRSQGEPDLHALPSISGCREKTTAYGSHGTT